MVNILKLTLYTIYIYMIKFIVVLPSVSLMSITCLIIFNGINLICLYDLAPFNLCEPEFGSLGLFPLHDFLFLQT